MQTLQVNVEILQHLQGKAHAQVSHKASLTSRRTCTYVLVTEKNWRICKTHLRYLCDFITEFQCRTDPAMKIDMHIFSTCTQYGHKYISSILIFLIVSWHFCVFLFSEITPVTKVVNVPADPSKIAQVQPKLFM